MRLMVGDLELPLAAMMRCEVVRGWNYRNGGDGLF